MSDREALDMIKDAIVWLTFFCWLAFGEFVHPLFVPAVFVVGVVQSVAIVVRVGMHERRPK